MATMTPTKKQEPETKGNGGTLMPSSDYPFFLSRLRDEFDRQFDRFLRGWPSLREGFGHGWRWGLDVKDEDDAVVIRAEAPGFEAADFDVQVRDNRLVLRAAKKVETKGKEGKVQEYREQECYDFVTLPPGIDKDRVEAQYHNGVLTVKFAKTAESKPKQIAIKST